MPGTLVLVKPLYEFGFVRFRESVILPKSFWEYTCFMATGILNEEREEGGPLRGLEGFSDGLASDDGESSNWRLNRIVDE